MDIWHSLTFTASGHSEERLYKTITLPDDKLVNPWKSLYLKLKTADYRVIVPDHHSHAVVWVQDNECECVKIINYY